MHTQAYGPQAYEPQAYGPQAHEPGAESHIHDDIDRGDLLDAVGSLRQDVRSMKSYLRDVIDEKERLKNEVERLRGDREHKSWLSEAQKVRQEVDHLVRLYDATASGETGRRKAPRRGPSQENSSPDQAPWMKKMMMFIMLAEMV